MNDASFAEECDNFLDEFRTQSVSKKKSTLKERLNRVAPNKQMEDLINKDS